MEMERNAQGLAEGQAKPRALRVYVGICGDFWGFRGPTTPRLNRFDPNGCNQVGTDASQVLAHLRTHGGCDVALLEGVLEWKNGCLELHAREVKFIPEPAGVEAGAGESPKALPPSSSRSPCSGHHAPPLEGAKTPARRRKAPMGGRTQRR